MATFDPMAIMTGARERNRKVYGLTVRCPQCNAGIGKFCLKPGITVHQNSGDIAIHATRVALANPK